MRAGVSVLTTFRYNASTTFEIETAAPHEAILTSKEFVIFVNVCHVLLVSKETSNPV